MKPIAWFLFGVFVALGGQAAAEFVDVYGNPRSSLEIVPWPVPGGSSFRDRDGTIHYSAPPVEIGQRSPC